MERHCNTELASFEVHIIPVPAPERGCGLDGVGRRLHEGISVVHFDLDFESLERRVATAIEYELKQRVEMERTFAGEFKDKDLEAFTVVFK